MSKDEFIVLYKQYAEDIRRYVFYRYGDEEMASDVMQDVFTKVWVNRLSLSADYMKSLLYKMATDYSNMNYRKQQSWMDFEKSIALDDNMALSPEDEQIFKELAALYAKTIGQMPTKRRTVFLMSREEGMKYAEIADKLHIGIKSVEKHVSAALQLLRKNLLNG